MSLDQAWIASARSVPIEDELARRGIKLHGNKVERDGPCPKCGGEDRFSINTKKQVFNCRGCRTGGDVIDLVRFLDGTEFIAACTTLAGEPPKANGQDHVAAAREVCVATFAYTDEGGTVLFMVGRLQYRNPDGSFVLNKDGKPKKTFRQKRPDPGRPGQWIHNVDGVRIVPYKLPELLEAIGNDHFVVIVEGEAKADLLWSWNVPATCCAMGAGKWKQAHAEFLRDANVVILPDNDEPGRDHADTVGASLQEIAKSVRVLELPKLGPKEDVVVWARQGGTVEQLHDLIAREARPWMPRQPNSKQRDHFADGKTSRAGLELVSAADVKMSAVQWLWQNRFALGKLNLLAGLPDKGKSQIACDITARITTTTGDKHWPCQEGVAPTGNVIIFSAEDDPGDTLKPRLLAAGADLSRVTFVKMVKTEAGARRMFDLAADLEQLRNAASAISDVLLVVFDPLNAYFGHHGRTDTFRGSDVRAVLGPLAELAAELKIAILGLLHFNKKTDVTNVMLRISDSLAFVAAARAVYAVIPDEENHRTLLVRGKNNLAPASLDKTLAYTCGTANVGDDPDTGAPIMAPHILWFPKHVEVTADEAMMAAADNRSPGQVEATTHFLTDLLSEGAIEHNEVNEAAEVAKISVATLRRACEKLRVEKRKQKGVQDGKWYWRLPDKGHPWPWEVPNG
jgi:putative DNA primase/helicase